MVVVLRRSGWGSILREGTSRGGDGPPGRSRIGHGAASIGLGTRGRYDRRARDQYQSGGEAHEREGSVYRGGLAPNSSKASGQDQALGVHGNV